MALTRPLPRLQDLVCFHTSAHKSGVSNVKGDPLALFFPETRSLGGPRFLAPVFLRQFNISNFYATSSMFAPFFFLLSEKEI